MGHHLVLLLRFTRGLQSSRLAICKKWSTLAPPHRKKNKFKTFCTIFIHILRKNMIRFRLFRHEATRAFDCHNTSQGIMNHLYFPGNHTTNSWYIWKISMPSISSWSIWIQNLPRVGCIPQHLRFNGNSQTHPTNWSFPKLASLFSLASHCLHLLHFSVAWCFEPIRKPRDFESKPGI